MSYDRNLNKWITVNNSLFTDVLVFKKNYSNGIMALPKFCGYTLNRQKKFCPPGQEITPVCVETAASLFSAPKTFSFFLKASSVDHV